ncbi:hypothetical protein FRX31_004688, partial [Thalictrum thalictroides]
RLGICKCQVSYFSAVSAAQLCNLGGRQDKCNLRGDPRGPYSRDMILLVGF